MDIPIRSIRRLLYNSFTSVLTGLVGAVIVLLLLSVDTRPAAHAVGCTPQAKSIATGAVQVAVDLCQEIQNFVPPPSTSPSSGTSVSSVVGLLCPIIEGGAPIATVIINSDVWNGMKGDYLRVHGALPAGMRAPIVAPFPPPPPGGK